MAKVECFIDTSDKSVEVKVDGKKVDNFGYLSVYGSSSPYGFMFSLASNEEMEDCTKTTYWSHSKEFVNEVDEFLRGMGKSDKASDDMDMDDNKDGMPVDKKNTKNKKKTMKTEDKKKC